MLANINQLVISWTQFWKFCYCYLRLYKQHAVWIIKEIFGENSQSRHLKFTVSSFSFVWNISDKYNMDAPEPLPTSLRTSSHSRHCAGVTLKLGTTLRKVKNGLENTWGDLNMKCHVKIRNWFTFLSRSVCGKGHWLWRHGYRMRHALISAGKAKTANKCQGMTGCNREFLTFISQRSNSRFHAFAHRCVILLIYHISLSQVLFNMFNP